MAGKKLKDKLQRALIFFLVIGSLFVIALTFYQAFLKIAKIVG